MASIGALSVPTATADDPDIPDVTIGTPPEFLVPGGLPADVDLNPGSPLAPLAVEIDSAQGSSGPPQGAGNTYRCVYSNFGTYGLQSTGAPADGSKGAGSTIYAGQDLRKVAVFGGSDSAWLYTYVGNAMLLGKAFTAVAVSGSWSYRGNVETNPGYSFVSGPGSA